MRPEDPERRLGEECRQVCGVGGGGDEDHEEPTGPQKPSADPLGPLQVAASNELARGVVDLLR